MELTQFMNVISQLVFKACQIIKSVHESECLDIKMKGHLNPVTVADVTIQSMIVNSLNKIWPNVQIVGEETIKDDAFCTSQNPQLENYTSFFQNYFQSKVLEPQDFCVWIDPLDGTLSFTKGKLEDVTVMIGVSYKQKARIGIIGIPYQKDTNSDSCIFDPKVVVSDCDSQLVVELNQDFSQFAIISNPKPKTKKLVISRNLPYHQAKMIKNITVQTIQTYAMGNKFIHMVKQKAAGLVYFGKVASLWDTCAGESLIRSLGGIVTNLQGNDIIYDHCKTNFELGKGLICAFQKSMLETINSQITY